MREAWLDNAKMFAMLCVIVGHVGDLFGGWPFDIGGVVVGFNMPLFFLMAGITSLSGPCKVDSFNSLLNYGEKILNRMVIPAVCLSAIDQVWIGLLFARKLWCIYGCGIILLNIINKYGDCFFRRWHIPTSMKLVKGTVIIFLLVASFWLNMYWFVSALLKMQLLFAVLVLLTKGYSTRFLVLYLSFIAFLFSYYYYDNWTFDMIFYYLLGIILHYHNLFDKLCKISLWINILLFLIGCVICKMVSINYGFYHFSLNRLIELSISYIYIVRIVVAMFISLPILNIIRILSHEYSSFSKMGSRTLAFYTIHCLLLEDFIKPYCRLEQDRILSWLLGLLFLPLFVWVVYQIILFLENFQFTKRYFLGIWK